jgi:tetratricopeptide (TPR) repeat protein
MRLTNSISKSLVVSAVAFVSLSLCASGAVGQEMPAADLQGWMHSGEKILQATRWDPDELLKAAEALSNPPTHGVNRSESSAALLLSAKLYAKAGKYPECVAGCQQVLDTYPRTSSAGEACELAGTVMADHLNKAAEAAELFQKRALGFPKESQADWFLRRAVELYETAGAWDRAAECAQSYADHFADRPSAAQMKLWLASIWMKQGDAARAKESLVEFTEKYGNDPWTVVARQTLAEIYASEGDREKAYGEQGEAWSWYQQHAKAAAKMPAEVRHAAALSLFELQEPRRTYFHRACEFTPNAVSDKNAIPLAKTLIENYNQVMLADPNMAVQALIAQAEVCEELGNFLLQQGYVQYANARGRQDVPPHEAAMEEYVRAIALYERAWDYSLMQEDTPELAKLSEQAATRAVELRLGNGDLAFGWALQLHQALPAASSVPKELDKRFQALDSQVYPVLAGGLAQYRDAQAMAVKMGLSRLAERARSGLAVPLEPFATDLFGLNRSAWDVVSTSTFQIVSSVQMSERAATAVPQLEQLEVAHMQADAFVPRTVERSREILMALRDAHASPESRTTWENYLLGYYQDYAAFCRDVSTKLSGAVERLKDKQGNEMMKLQSRLQSVSRDLVKQEYGRLEEAYDLCEELAITSPEADKILERLVALNPKEYSTKAETRFGTRQKP